PDVHLEGSALEEVRVVLELRDLEAADGDHSRRQLAVLGPPVTLEAGDDERLDPVHPLDRGVEAAEVDGPPEREVRAVEKAELSAAEVPGGERVLYRLRDV